MIAVVPLTGDGSAKDPKRPVLPVPISPNGIISFNYDVSDDGKYALVEFVARDPKAFDAVKADRRLLKTFERGKHSRQEVETELRKYKKNFDLGRFGTR